MSERATNNQLRGALAILKEFPDLSDAALDIAGVCVRTLNGNRPHGESHYRAKLTQDQVHKIRELRAAGWKLQALGDEYGVTKALVSKICRGEIWR